jgi:hypothetical protein
VGPFSLYTTASCELAQRVNAGQVFDLKTPVTEGGVTLFRRSLWLPLPASARVADALQVAAGSTLALRFEALEVDAATSDTTWMPECALSGGFLHLALALPLPIVQLVGTRSSSFDLHRRDGDTLAEDALASGSLNARLPEPPSGMAFALKLPQFIEDQDRFRSERTPQVRMQAKSAKGIGAQSNIGIVDGEAGSVKNNIALVPQIRRDGVLKALRLAGKPTNPRMRLVRQASADKPEETLWLDLRPGVHASALLLPADAPPKAWAPALEHLLAANQNPKEEPVTDLVLRLDLESDAPCRVTVQAISLALVAETELLESPQTLKFSGTHAKTLTVALPAVTGLVEEITVKATLGGDATAAPAASSALPGDGRTGTLLGPDQRIVRALDLATPLRLSGISLPWHPLSDRVTWTVQLCTDAGDRPALPALIEATIDADTPTAAWVALRWPPMDLQGGRYWLRLVANDGSGLWLHATSGLTTPGWVEAARSPLPNPLPLGGVLALATLSPTDAPPCFTLRAGGQSLTLSAVDSAPPTRLEAQHTFTSPTAPGPNLAIETAQPVALKVESVRVSQRL